MKPIDDAAEVEVPVTGVEPGEQQATDGMLRASSAAATAALPSSDRPHIAVFVGNLPTGLSQKQYEKILLDIIGKGECVPCHAASTSVPCHAASTSVPCHAASTSVPCHAASTTEANTHDHVETLESALSLRNFNSKVRIFTLIRLLVLHRSLRLCRKQWMFLKLG